MDCMVHRITKRRTPLSDFHFTSLYFMLGFHCHCRLSLVMVSGGYSAVLRLLIAVASLVAELGL